MCSISLEDLEADLDKATEFAVSELCLLLLAGLPFTSELVDCWLSLRGRIRPREYSETEEQGTCTNINIVW